VTQQQLRFRPAAPARGAVSPMEEMGAYEMLWSTPGMSFKRMADLFRQIPEAMPSDLSGPVGSPIEMAETVVRMLKERGVSRFGVRLHRAGEYPAVDIP